MDWTREKEAFHDNLVHYNWHWFWNYETEILEIRETPDGHCPLDDSRSGLAKSIFCVGGRFGYKDQGETANTRLAIFDYGESLSSLMHVAYPAVRTWVFPTRLFQ